MAGKTGYEVRLKPGPAARPPSIVAVLPGLGGSNPRGDVIGFTNAYMTWNGEPWTPVCGEFHYSRYPASGWARELAKMKAYGVDIVSSYVFWNHHEETEGRFDWSGNRDLGRFIRLCGREGLHAIVRVGPFAHGEARNGGLPDWLYGMPVEARSNDERYLLLVRGLYREIARRIAGMFFRDGGPVIGIQLENELMHAGAPWETAPWFREEYVPSGTGGAEHLLALKRIAVEEGLDAPLFTCTAWGGSPVPPGEMLPVHGGYAFWPWTVSRSEPEQRPTGEFLFRDFRSSGRRDEWFDPAYDPGSLPFACAEIGAGAQTWHRHRFIVRPECAEAIALVKLAGGCSLLGYYMFHGGSNPSGRSFMNERVVPRISYDFQAPIGEYGQVRESCRRLARLHAFLRHFGKRLAGMATALPESAAVPDPADASALRIAARTAGDSGFLFFNNFQDHVEMPDRENVSVTLELPRGEIRIPFAGGFTLRAGACALMPFNLEADGVRVVHSTAQPLARLESGGEAHYFFFSREGIPAEYLLDSSTIRRLECPNRTVTETGGLFLVEPEPGSGIAFRAAARSGARVAFHTLTEAQSLGFHVLEAWGRERALITEAELVPQKKGLLLRSRDPSAGRLTLRVLPDVRGGLKAHEPGGKGDVPLAGKKAGEFTEYGALLAPARTDITVEGLGKARAVVRVPPDAFAAAAEVILSVDYEGDSAEAYAGGRLAADDFSNGTPWEIGLDPETPELFIRVWPRPENAFVCREPGTGPGAGAGIKRIEARPVREIFFTAR
jgi:beta-galactosidase